MYLLEYMVYHMRPFGVGHYTCPAEAQSMVEKIMSPGGATRLVPGLAAAKDDKLRVDAKESR